MGGGVFAEGLEMGMVVVGEVTLSACVDRAWCGSGVCGVVRVPEGVVGGSGWLGKWKVAVEVTGKAVDERDLAVMKVDAVVRESRHGCGTLLRSHPLVFHFPVLSRSLMIDVC